MNPTPARCLGRVIETAGTKHVVMLDPPKPYFLINREERHLAAVLFHLLCLGDNLTRLVHSRRPNWPVLPDECGVYFEYSFLRDAWHSLGKGEAANA